MVKRIVQIIVVLVVLAILAFILAAIFGSGSAKAASPYTAATAKLRGAGAAMPVKAGHPISITPTAAAIAASGGMPRCFAYSIENPFITHVFHKKEFWVRFIKNWCIRLGRVTWAPEPVYEWGVTGYGAFWGWKEVSHNYGTTTNAEGFTESRLSVNFVQDFSVDLGLFSVGKTLNAATLPAEIYGDTLGHHSYRYN